MAYQCINCGKGNWRGKRSRHHKGVAGAGWKHKAQKSPKIFRANIRNLRVLSDGTITRVKLCTDCLSLLKKQNRLIGKTEIRTLFTSSAPSSASV